VKFRANHDWGTNWGSKAFPSGNGVNNGDNIPIATGNTFFVWFNDVSGEYYFGATANSAPYATGVSLIGPAASDWSTDVNLTTNPNNSYLFSKIVTLTEWSKHTSKGRQVLCYNQFANRRISIPEIVVSERLIRGFGP
jgi:hypothetical protein